MVRSFFAIMLFTSYAMAQDFESMPPQIPDQPSEKLYLQAQLGSIALAETHNFTWLASILTRLSAKYYDLGLGLGYTNNNHVDLSKRSSTWGQVSVSSIDLLLNKPLLSFSSLSLETQLGVGYGMTTALDQAGEALQKSYLNSDASIQGVWTLGPKWSTSAQFAYKRAFAVGQEYLQAADLSGLHWGVGVRWQP